MNNLNNIAQELGAVDVCKRLQKAETLAQRSQTHIGIIGPANCGKTTLINGILGQEVRKPSLVPSECLPLRVVFDRMADDERFECVHVFHREWGNTDTVLYEFTSEKILKDESWTDELDILFYLSPLSHFMTAEDKKAVQRFAGIPVQVIATQCDRVAGEDLEKAREFAKKACERMNLAEPICADPESWQNVSEKMRRALPLAAALVEIRKTHQDKIKECCREQLIGHIDQMIEAEQSNQQSLQEQYEAQLRKDKLTAMTGNRIYQEMKLRCSTASNDMVAQVRTSIQKIDGFAQQMIEEGRQCRFDEMFQQRLSKQADSLLNEQIHSLQSQMKVSLASIASDAVAQKTLDEKDLQSIKQSGNLPHGGDQRIRFDKSTGNEVSYLIQSVAGIGAVSAVTLLSRAPTPLSIGLIAASTVAGGAAYICRNAASRTARNEAAIRNWARSCTDEMQTVLIPNIQRIYKMISDTMHMPPIEQTAPDQMPAVSDKVVHLQAIAASLKV